MLFRSVGGVGGNADDQFRNAYAYPPARERLAQIQYRFNLVLRYDWDKTFLRSVASWLDYNMMTDWHPASAPWAGYQNFVDRYDANGGLDFGYKLTPKLAATLGYRYGSQYQQRLPTVISPTDSHYSSGDYQRLLLGLEGKPYNWLDVKVAGGPDFRRYNSLAPVPDHNPIKYYAEAVIAATLTSSQTLTFNYKQWQWVSSTGKVPYYDSTYGLSYRWNATKRLEFELGGKVLEADYTIGNDFLGSTQPSLRDDMEYEISAGVTCAINSHFSANLSYICYLGDNALANLPSALGPAYREFKRQVISIGLQCKF